MQKVRNSSFVCVYCVCIVCANLSTFAKRKTTQMRVFRCISIGEYYLFEFP